MPRSMVGDELKDCKIKDKRVKKRFRIVIENLCNVVGKPISLVCQDRANTKAAYRFLSNKRVSEDQIMEGYFNTTQQRFKESKAQILVLQDTTEFSYQRENVAAVGIIKVTNSGKDKKWRNSLHTVCSILIHSSLVVTTDGLPLRFRTKLIA